MTCLSVIHRNHQFHSFKRACSSHESLWDSSVFVFIVIGALREYDTDGEMFKSDRSVVDTKSWSR